MTLPPIMRAQKSPLEAGGFGKIGASTEVPQTLSAGDFRKLVIEEPTMQRIYLSARARVCHPPVCPSTYPDPSHVRRVLLFIGQRQRVNGGQPVPLTPAEIERETGVTQSDQIRIRQTLMLEGVLRLSVIDGAWAYALESQL